MDPMRRLVLAAAFLQALPAFAGVVLPLPRSGERLRSPDRFEIRLPEQALPEGADEKELVLSLDGGQSYPVRVTAETGAADTILVFRVPNLPSARARIALRAGDGAREVVVAESAVFVIERDPASPLETVTRIGREFGTREALEGRAGEPLPSSCLASRDESFLEARNEPAPAEAPSPFLLHASPGEAPGLAGAPSLSIRPAVPPVSRLPLDRPKRE
jgi:hypothetical protein